jgi:hypothetical protein
MLPNSTLPPADPHFGLGKSSGFARGIQDERTDRFGSFRA